MLCCTMLAHWQCDQQKGVVTRVAVHSILNWCVQGWGGGVGGRAVYSIHATLMDRG